MSSVVRNACMHPRRSIEPQKVVIHKSSLTVAAAAAAGAQQAEKKTATPPPCPRTSTSRTGMAIFHKTQIYTTAQVLPESQFDNLQVCTPYSGKQQLIARPPAHTRWRLADSSPLALPRAEKHSHRFPGSHRVARHGACGNATWRRKRPRNGPEIVISAPSGRAGDGRRTGLRYHLRLGACARGGGRCEAHTGESGIPCWRRAVVGAQAGHHRPGTSCPSRQLSRSWERGWAPGYYDWQASERP